jgi:hypothetical protein
MMAALAERVAGEGLDSAKTRSSEGWMPSAD